MPIQTSYTETMRAGVVGAIVNTEPNNLISRTVEGAAIGFGVPVAQGAGDKGARATAAGDTAARFVGVTVREHSVRPETPNSFAVGETARVMTRGVIWVTASIAVAAGDPVFVTVATGAFRNSATATAGAEIQIPNSRFDTSAAAGALVQLRLDR
jgi:hypothetical protein